tara:strand:+ start:293 stop:604 length:312 start_codon:yes stop_codon:yes gene_type:complete
LKKINKILDYLSELNIDKDKRVADFLVELKNQSKIVTDKGFNKLEIKKYKLQLSKKKLNLGIYISEKYSINKIQDFSYDEDYKSMNEEIILLEKYIEKLKQTF